MATILSLRRLAISVSVLTSASSAHVSDVLSDVPIAGSRVLASSDPESEACPPEMALVDGTFCVRAAHRCRRWLDSAVLPYARCAEYAQPAVCTGTKARLRYCIDRYEYTAPAEALPVRGASLINPNAVCEGLGKRLCPASEWTFACEGEEMRPYPYGWSREPVCNQDRLDLFERGPSGSILRDLREPGTARPKCVSPWGVFNLVGNLDEVVRRDVPVTAGHTGVLKGGWWLPGRNRCRAETAGHADFYRGAQVGIRCCAGPHNR
jgi:formylglycine-generating enzyme